MSHHLVILGAGISGLATAWFLRQCLGSKVRLTILETSGRAGGWIQTIHQEGFLFEQGPRSFRSKGNGYETLALVEALGLEKQLLIPHTNARHRYIYCLNGLQRLPKHLWEMPFSVLTKGFVKALWKDWHQPKRQESDESIYDFFNRRLGSSWIDHLIDPFVLGIYAGDCRRLSLKSCFPLFDQWEQQHGSLLKGAWYHSSSDNYSHFVQSMRRFPLFSFREGMETLPRALATELKDCLYFNQLIKSVTLQRNQVKIQLNHGEYLQADRVISTLPAYALSPLFSSQVKNQLQGLNYATVAIVNFGFNSFLPLKGFGYLVPSKLKSLILGSIWDSSIFPSQDQKNQTRLTVMMGGTQHPEIEEMDEQVLIEEALIALKEHLKIKILPQVIQVKKARKAIPQYELGYQLWKENLRETLNQAFPLFTLSGSSFTGVSINDCIAHAHQLASQISIQLESQ